MRDEEIDLPRLPPRRLGFGGYARRITPPPPPSDYSGHGSGTAVRCGILGILPRFFSSRQENRVYRCVKRTGKDIKTFLLTDVVIFPPR